MRLSLGRYIPYNSPIHRMDPRFKLFTLLFLIASLFFHSGFTGYIILGFVIFTLFFMSKLRAIMLWKIFKPIIFMVIVLFLVNCLLIKPGDNDYIGKYIGTSWFYLSEKAAYQSIYLGVRIFYMITLTTILTSTTRSLDLTLAIEDLLSPLKIVKFPVHILSTIISIALRMIPTLIDEAGRIMKAQASRGIDFRNGKFKEKIKASVSLIIPLLVSSFQKAEDLAYAMDARGYNPKSPRTRYRKYKINIYDFAILLLCVGFAALVIASCYTNILPITYVKDNIYLDKFIHI